LQQKQQAALMGMEPPGEPQPGEQPPVDETQPDMDSEQPPLLGDGPQEGMGEPADGEASRYSMREDIEAAAALTDVNPSDEQKAAGNYRKGKIRLHGLEIAIENPKGSARSGVGYGGKPWSITMANHYGYIKKTESEADGDHVDVFIGPDPKSEVVFVINQTKGPTWTHFDEHKVMLGWHTADAAKQGYLDNYSAGWNGFDSIITMTMDQFKDWLEHGSTGERAVSRYSVTANLYSQVLARYYKASSDEAQERFWAGDERDIVVIQDRKPMRYSRRHGQVSASYVTTEAT